MTDEAQAALEAAPEVVQPEAEQVEAAEAPESTEGQEETQPAEVEDQPEAEQETEEKSPSKLRRERRKAYQEQLRQEAQDAQKELERVKARLEVYEAPEQSTQPPKEADFQDYNEFLMATAAYQAGQQFDARQKAEIQRLADEQQQQVDAVAERQQAEAQEHWAAQVADAKSRYADFEAVAFAPDVSITNDMAQILASSDVGADVAYHLGTNKAEAARIASLPPLEQAMALGRLEAAVSLPKPRTQSAAPEPVKPVKAKATAGGKDPDEMSMAEYIAWRKGGK